MGNCEGVNLPLKAAIIARFGTQFEFCATMREHPTVVSAVIRGRRTIPEAKRQKWAEALGAKVKDLFPQEGPND